MIRKALVVITWRREPLATERKILVLRVIPSRGAFWQPVTGRVDQGETFAEAALREAEEETGFSFERMPQYLGLQYEFAGKENQPITEQAFFLPLFGGEEAPVPNLDPKEHDAYQWLDVKEALSLLKFPHNREALERACGGASPLFLSKTGIFFQDGEEVTHARTVEFLHRSLLAREQGFVVAAGQEELDVVVEDLPHFIRSFAGDTGEITLMTGDKEELRPETLEVRKDHSVVAETSRGKAVFLSPAYYALAKEIRLEGKEYILHFRGRDYRLGVSA